MTPGDDAFVEFLGLARGGDRGAAEELARSYEKDVRIAARVLLGPALRPHLDTLDLVQSVHRSLLLGLRQDKFNVSSPAQLVASALTLVRRKVARKWRRHRRQTRLSASSVPGEGLAEVFATLRDAGPDPARAAQVRDAVDRVCRELDDDRRLLELRLDGWTTAEAARQLGSSPDVLRVRLSRLRKHLHEHGILNEWL